MQMRTDLGSLQQEYKVSQTQFMCYISNFIIEQWMNAKWNSKKK